MMWFISVDELGWCLIGFGVIFSLIEAILPSFGASGFSAAAFFMLGAYLLKNPDEAVNLPWELLVPLGVIMAILSFIVACLSWRALKLPIAKNQGETGVAMEDFVGGVGKIRLDGEIWASSCSDSFAIRKGDRVLIKGSKGLLKIVVPE